MCSGRHVSANIADAGNKITEAAGKGAQLILTPEVTNLMEESNKALTSRVDVMEKDQAVTAFASLAHDLKVHLLIGSLALKSGSGKLVNRSILFLPDGSIAAYYDKIHMFDVDLGGKETYRESANYTAGSRAVVAPITIGNESTKIGLSICYDLRFAHLYRQLAKAGAQILAIPAAFTQVSGQAHWHILQRARAIENGCFVIAAAQSGRHENGRQTFGHSLIVSPWGEIIAEANDGTGMIIADLDLSQVDDTRARIPSLHNDREFSL
jgi:predicted amidohydrolase